MKKISSKKIILCDFDGVIHKASKGFGVKGEIYDLPTENCVFSLQKLTDQGFKIVIFTARERKDFKLIKKWMKVNKLPELEITNRKIPALAYIDDRAIRFTNWADIVHYFI